MLHHSLLDTLVSYEENEVLWIQSQFFILYTWVEPLKVLHSYLSTKSAAVKITITTGSALESYSQHFIFLVPYYLGTIS
jgi:hypothetical protein